MADVSLWQTVRTDNELYLYYKGDLVYKKWDTGTSVLFNKGWLPEWINHSKQPVTSA